MRILPNIAKSNNNLANTQTITANIPEIESVDMLKDVMVFYNLVFIKELDCYAIFSKKFESGDYWDTKRSGFWRFIQNQKWFKIEW